MSQILDSLNVKQKKLEDLLRQEAKRQGRLEEVMKQLKGLGLDSLEAAEMELAQMLETVDQNEQRLKEIDVELGKIIDGAKNVESL